jgi:thymidylate synthase
MKPAFIEAINLNEAYYQLLYQCWEKGVRYEITEGSNKGGFRLELPFAAGYIHNPHMRPLAPTMPLGVAPTTTDDAIQAYFVKYLMDPNLEENEEYRYSTWVNKPMRNMNKGRYVSNKEYVKMSWEEWKNWKDQQEESQLEWCIRHLKEKGHGNNHCYITVGEPGGQFVYDREYTTETERRTTPCLRGIDIKVKDNKVILGVLFRSWDLYAGFPENMGGFTLLNQYIASEIGVNEGPLTFASQGLHCYDYQIKQIQSYLRKD